MNPIVCYYVTRDAVTCAACRATGPADASCSYYFRDYEVILKCPACGNTWQTRDDLILDGRDLRGGKDMAASEMM